MSAKTAIGIDPDKGIAVWDVRARRLLRVSTTTFWDIIEILRQAQMWDGGVEVHIEAPYMNKPTWITSASRYTQDKVSQNVGANKMKALLLVEFCRRMNIVCFERKPTAKSFTKMSAEQFAKITGWTDRTSDHGRDAAMLVFGI
jgi:hypothetical protein